jgi:hypothetical protein
MVEEMAEVLNREVRGKTLVLTAMVRRGQLARLEKKGTVRVNLAGD